MAYMRKDTFLVTIEGDPVAWDRSEGGHAVAGDPERFTPLVLERLRSDRTAPLMVDHMARIGTRAAVTVAHLGGDAAPTGRGLRYTGRLVRVELATFDANYDLPAYDRIVLQPTDCQPVQSHA